MPIAVNAIDGVRLPCMTAYVASDAAESRIGLEIQQLHSISNRVDRTCKLRLTRVGMYRH